MSGPFITMLRTGDLAEFDAHFARHRQESGRGDIHFMPFAPDATDGPLGLDPERIQRPLNQPGWQRWWGAWSGGGASGNRQMIGHVNLKADFLQSRQHRVVLGIGIEQDYRGEGLGRALMTTAINFTQRAEFLHWLDLQVFAHNLNAIHLYQSLGFVENGRIRDSFRIGDVSIDDVSMALAVG